MPKKQTREDQRLDMVRRFEGSGLTAAAFARQEGVSVGTLANWRKRAARARTVEAEEAPSFPPVTLVPEAPMAPTPVAELALPGGRRLQVVAGFEAEELKRLIKVLEAC